MGDLISRQAAIEALGEEPPVWCDTDGEIAEREQWRCDVATILAVPSVEPKTGKWVRVDEKPYFRKHFHKVCCSNCNKEGYKKWNYCPNCGSYNGGKKVSEHE